MSVDASSTVITRKGNIALCYCHCHRKIIKGNNTFQHANKDDNVRVNNNRVFLYANRRRGGKNEENKTITNSEKEEEKAITAIEEE